MNQTPPSFFARIGIAFTAFFRILSDAGFAEYVKSSGGAPAKAAAPQVRGPAFTEAPPDSALQLLGLLQQEGRLIDFLEEDVSSFSDADIGAAARVVHEGCRKAVVDHFKIVPVRDEPEGSRVTLNDGFNAALVRVTGNVTGRPPFSGKLIHRGWRVASASLPKLARGHDTSILAAAEVEL